MNSAPHRVVGPRTYPARPAPEPHVAYQAPPPGQVPAPLTGPIAPHVPRSTPPLIASANPTQPARRRRPFFMGR